MRSDARKKLAESSELDQIRAYAESSVAEWNNDRRALGAAVILLDRTEAALRITIAERDAQAVQLDEIRRVAQEWAETEPRDPDDFLRGHMAGMQSAGGAILHRLAMGDEPERRAATNGSVDER